jgi:predicted amidophosphoribosyltransferase
MSVQEGKSQERKGNVTNGIIIIVLSTIYSIIIASIVHSFMGVRYIGEIWSGRAIAIPDGLYVIMWAVAIAGYGFGAWTIFSNIQTQKVEREMEYDLATSKNCPKCAETIKLEARVCKHCGYEFSDEEIEKEREERKKALEQDEHAFNKLSDYKLLKLAGYYQYVQSNFSKAQYYLEKLLKEYPKSTYVDVAKKRLAEMGDKALLPPEGAPITPTCPHCQKPISATAEYCQNCGAAIGQELATSNQATCPQCGYGLNPGANYCGGCGNKLS